MKKINIETGEIVFEAELNDSPTADKIYDLLPVTGNANVWGDEIYFTLPLHIEQAADAKQDVEVGDLAFWPEGDAFCIFFGPTPASSNNMPRAYSPVNVFGRIREDAAMLKQVQSGDIIKVTKKAES